MVTEDSDTDVFIFVETHLQQQKAVELRERLFRQGWRIHWAAALPNKRSHAGRMALIMDMQTKANSGGLFIISRSFHGVTSISPMLDGSLGQINEEEYILTTLRLSNMSIVIGACYLSPYLWLGQKENYTTLAKLAAHLHLLGVPFVSNGDFNCTSDKLLTIGWLDKINATIVACHDLPFNCTAGSRRTIDQWVVSNVLLKRVTDVVPADQVPCKPHVASRMVLHLDIRRSMQNVQDVPQQIPVAHGPARPWQYYHHEAQSRLQSTSLSHHAGLNQMDKLHGGAMQPLAHRYAAIATSVEILRADIAGIVINSDIVGRALPWRTKQVPQSFVYKIEHSLFRSDVLNLMAVIDARLHEVVAITTKHQVPSLAIVGLLNINRVRQVVHFMDNLIRNNRFVEQS